MTLFIYVFYVLTIIHIPFFCIFVANIILKEYMVNCKGINVEVVMIK